MGGAVTVLLFGRLQRLLLRLLVLITQPRILRQPSNQHPQTAGRQARTAAIQVAEINAQKRKIGLDRVTVVTDQSDEAGEFPESPISASTLSDNSSRSRPLSCIP